MPLTSMAPAIQQQKSTFLLITEHCCSFQRDPGATHKSYTCWLVCDQIKIFSGPLKQSWLKSFEATEAEGRVYYLGHQTG